MINIPKGTKDVLPSESYKWHYVESKARETARLYGFREIRTPSFEHTELFTRSIGDDTDVVQKEMYTFLDKGKTLDYAQARRYRAGRPFVCRKRARIAFFAAKNVLYNAGVPLRGAASRQTSRASSVRRRTVRRRYARARLRGDFACVRFPFVGRRYRSRS